MHFVTGWKLAMLTTDLPKPSIARVCGNCKLFKKYSEGIKWRGICKLPLLMDATANPIPVHATMTCSAHIWKKHGTIQRISETYNAEIPE